jgi:hypothetical protein
MVRELIEDSSGRWWATPANLDLLIGATRDELWSEIHDVKPWFTSQLDELTALDAPGFIDTRLTATGDLSQRILRVQKIVRDGREYHEVRAQDVVIEDEVMLVAEQRSQNVYVRMGDQLHLLPYATSGDVEIRYSFLPALFSGLADGDAVLWPDGHELALVFGSAARARSRGDTEDVSTVAAFAEQSWQRLLARVRKMSVGPQGPYFNDTPEAWGGE